MAHLRDGPRPTGHRLRFGVFEVDPRSGELLKHGVRIPLQPRPFQALLLLLQHANQVVSREEMQRHLWSADVFVDFDHGLNTAIRKVRRALNDEAERPRFIETVGRQGYRFLVPVELDQPVPEAKPALDQTSGASDAMKGFAGSVDEPDAQATLEPPSIVSNTNRRTGRRWILAAAIFAAVFTAYMLRPPMPVPHIGRVVQLTKHGAARPHEPLYTDGPRVYYQLTGPLATDPQLRQVLLNGNEDTPMAVPAGRFRIRGLSPDDTEFLALSSMNSEWTVWTVPVSGGSPRRLGNLVADDIAWSHEGNCLAYSRSNQLFLAKPDGTSSRLLATLPDPSARIDHVRWSPDNRQLRFTGTSSPSQALWEVGSDGSNLHELRFNWPGNPTECCGEWTADGRYFVFKSRREDISNLWVLEEKPDWWQRANRDPIQLTSGPVNYYQPLPSRNGKSIFAIGAQQSGELVRYDTGRKGFADFLGGQSYAYLQFSNDGKWLAYVAYPDWTLWRARSDGTEQVQLTFPPLQVGAPRWSPDGKRITFPANAPGQQWRSFVISSDGGNTQPFPSETRSQGSPDWMPGSDALIYSREVGAENPALYLFDLQSGRSQKIPGTDGLYGPIWSPDGHYLFASDRVTGTQILIDLKSGRRTRIAGPAGWPHWSPDSKYLYFIKDGTNWIFRVRVPDGKEENILQVPFRLTAWPFTVAPDGSLIMLREHGSYDVYALSLSIP